MISIRNDYQGLFSGPMSEKKMPTPNYLLKYKASNNFI